MPNPPKRIHFGKGPVLAGPYTSRALCGLLRPNVVTAAKEMVTCRNCRKALEARDVCRN